MLNFFPHSPPLLLHSPLSLIILYKKRKSTHVLHSQHELKYAVLIALSLVTTAADQTNVDRRNYSVSIVQFNSQHFDLQPCWLIFFFVFLPPVNRTTLLCRVNNTYTSTVWPRSRTASAFFFYPSCLAVTSLIPDPPPCPFSGLSPVPFSFLR